MLTTDDLARAAEMVVGRLSSEADEPDVPCLRNHLDIARAGIEEGLKLALRLLRRETAQCQNRTPVPTTTSEAPL